MDSPGYQAVEAFRLYTRSLVIDADDPGKNDIAIILPARYEPLTREAVAEHVSAKADEALGYDDDDVPSFLRSPLMPDPLLDAIKQLPVEVQQFIASRDVVTERLRVSVPNDYIESDDPTDIALLASYNVLPEEMVLTGRDLGGIGPADYIKATLSGPSGPDYGHKWEMHLLLEGGNLPDRDELTTLINHQTSKSRMLKVSDPNYNVNDLRGVADFFYDGMKPIDLGCLDDISDRIIEQAAQETFNRLISDIARRQQAMRERF